MTAPPRSPEQAREGAWSPVNAARSGTSKGGTLAALRHQPCTPSAHRSGCGSNSLVASSVGDRKNANAPSGRYLGELRITDAVLDSNLSPAAKLIPAVIARAGGLVSLTDFEKALPARRQEIVRAIRELEEGGWLTVERPTKRRGKTPKYDKPNRYTLTPHANPRKRNKAGALVNGTTRLRLDDTLGRTCGRWVLRAVYEREQLQAGAVQMPDAVAAHRAGMTTKAVKLARIEWTNAGTLRVVRRGTRLAVAVFVVEHTFHAHNLDRFTAGRRQTRTVEWDGAHVTLWGTRREAALVYATMRRHSDEREKIAAWIRQTGGPLADARLFGYGLSLKWPRRDNPLDDDTAELFAELDADPVIPDECDPPIVNSRTARDRASARLFSV